MKETNIPCCVCDRVIPDTEKIYVYSYHIQRVVGPGNIVRLAESHFSACHACRTKLKIKGQMDAAETALIAQVRKFRTESNGTSIENQLSCCVCGKWLPEGFNDLIVTHTREKFFGGRDRLERKVIYNVASCIDCDGVICLKQSIDLMLGTLTDNWRSAAFKSS